MPSEDPAKTTFDQLYREQADALLVWFARRTLDKDAALELVAESFAKAYEGRRRLRSRERESATRWLWGIAKNQLRRYWRKGRVEARAFERLGLERPALTQHDQAELERQAELAELRRLIAGALDGLGEEQRQAVRMRIVEEMAYSEIAAELGIREDAVRARVSRGLKRLQKLLEQDSPQEQIAQMEVIRS